MASSPIDIVKVYYATFSLMGADKAAQFLAPDFTLDGWAAAPLDKSTWSRFLVALKKALPDLKFHLSAVSQNGSEVEFTETGVGTHTRPLEMSAVDLPDIPASGRQIRFADLRWRFTVKNDKIQRAEQISGFAAERGLPHLVRLFAAQPAPGD